jgi:hypothetical protein
MAWKHCHLCRQNFKASPLVRNIVANTIQDNKIVLFLRLDFLDRSGSAAAECCCGKASQAICRKRSVFSSTEYLRDIIRPSNVRETCNRTRRCSWKLIEQPSSLPELSISFEPLRSTWVTKDLRKT